MASLHGASMFEILSIWVVLLIAFLGLDWDAACLRFHETARPVRSASMNQVRQPLYRSSLGRWTPFRDELGPLLAALGRS